MAVASTKANIMDIAVAAITVPAGRRRLDPNWVATLAELFVRQGQQSPIEVIAEEDGYRLVFGHHRLAAAKQLGWPTIESTVKTVADYASEAEITLAEISENLARRELSALDRSVDIARWRTLYEAANTVKKAGQPRKRISANSALILSEADDEGAQRFAASFAGAAQKAFGLSRRGVFNATKIATIDAEARELIALHAIADNQAELLALAAEPIERQRDIARLLAAAAAGTIAESIAILDRTPKPQAEPRWQKVASAFSLLKPVEQRSFFELHEGAITLWLKERGSR